MPQYTIQSPDGRHITIEANDEATAIRGAQEWSSANPAGAKPVKKAGYSFEGIGRDFKRPFDDARANMDKARAGEDQLIQGLLKGDVGNYVARYPLVKGEQALAALEGVTAPLNGAVNALVRPWTDLGADTAYNAGLRADDDVEANREKVNQGVGAVGGLASMFLGRAPTKAPKVPVGFKGLPKAPKPIPLRTQQVRTLQDGGVRNLTPGQLYGGLMQNTEDAIATTAGPVRMAKTRANEALQEGIMNDALSPIGGSVRGAGRDAVHSMHTQVGNALDNAFGNAKFVDDAQLHSEAVRAQGDVIPYSQQDALSIYNQFVRDASHPDGLSEAFARLTKFKTQAGRDGKADLADFIQGLQTSVLDNLARNGAPEDAAAVTSARDAFRRSIVPETAAAKVGAEGGVPSPEQLFSAVRETDRTVRKNAFAQGEAQYQTIAEAAKAVMGKTIGSSGTAERGSLTDPVAWVALTARNLALKGVYNRPVIALLNQISRAQNPQQSAAAVNALRNLARTDQSAARALTVITGGGNTAGAVAPPRLANPPMLSAAAAEEQQ